MNYTYHAQQRMEERSFTLNQIERNLDLFYAYGTWNARGDRVTLNTADNTVHKVIKERKSILKALIEKADIISAKSNDIACKINKGIAIASSKKNKIKRMLKELKRLDNKRLITLVIIDNNVITLYQSTKRNLKNTEKRTPLQL